MPDSSDALASFEQQLLAKHMQRMANEEQKKRVPKFKVPIPQNSTKH